MRNASNKIRVWDPLVRVFHLLLILCVAAAYFSQDGSQTVHLVAGGGVFILILIRFFWGFVGPRHARFTDFIFSPKAVIVYLADLVRMKARRHLGHGPAGGAMVIAFLISLFMTVLSGAALYGGQEFEGPLFPLMASLDDVWSEAAEGVHEFFSGLTLALAGLHVAGVLFASYAHWENLIGGMITGFKRAAEHDPQGPDFSKGRPKRPLRLRLRWGGGRPGSRPFNSPEAMP